MQTKQKGGSGMKERTYRKGDIVYREGEHSDRFYQIVSGSVEIVTDYGKNSEKALTDIPVGQFFGEISAIGGYARSATVVAASDGTKLVELTDSDMNDFFTGKPEMILGLMRHLGSRVRRLSADYDEASRTLEQLKASAGLSCPQGLMDKVRLALRFGGSAKKGLSAEAKEARAAAKNAGSRVKAYPAGTLLYREGEPGTCMYRIHWGRVGIFAGYGTDGERKLTELGVDQFFGTMGMLDGKARSATAVALDADTTLERIGPEDIQALFRENPNVVWMILEHIALRLRHLTQDYIGVCREIAALTGI